MSSGESVTAKSSSVSATGRAIMFDVLKGGYGKSTLSMNLADRIAAKGYDVLYMDLDPNGHITQILGYEDVYSNYYHDYGYVITDEHWYSEESLDADEMIYETEWGWDFVPAYNDMETFNETLKKLYSPSKALAEGFIRPLITEGVYDFIIMDGGGERSKIADNGFFAGNRAIIPVCPGKEAESALRVTLDRVVKPLSQQTNFKILAVVPNKLSERIDQQTGDRKLLENLNQTETFSQKLPAFARITENEFERIDAGESNALPGIRKDGDISNAIENGQPVAHFEPESKSVTYFDELAELVINQEEVQ